MHDAKDHTARKVPSKTRRITVRVLTTAAGAALMAASLYWGIDVARIYLQPTAPVRLSCSGVDRHDCPATWTVHGHSVRGTASDPYSGHRYSRLIQHADHAVLTMHISGTRATMSPAWWSLPGAFFGLFWGAAIALKAYRRRWLRPRRSPGKGSHTRAG